MFFVCVSGVLFMFVLLPCFSVVFFFVCVCFPLRCVVLLLGVFVVVVCVASPFKCFVAFACIVCFLYIYMIWVIVVLLFCCVVVLLCFVFSVCLFPPSPRD